MASARDLKKQIRSISNTAKITGTMEMVATAKSKKAQDRITATLPYSSKLEEILQNLKAAGTVAHPLLESRAVIRRNLLLIVTANRGLCGGYNTGVLGHAEKWVKSEADAGRETDVYMSGKKGIGRFRFLKQPMAKQYTHFEDRPSFVEAAEVAEEFMSRFLAGEVDRVTIISSRFESISVQRPRVTQLLPIQPPARAPGGDKAGGDEADSGSKVAVDFFFEPDREEILRQLLPLSIKQLLFRILLEAAASEQFARRVAMKLATDNAEELIKIYTRKYNRERQAGITQQLIEIMTGAEALE